MPYFSFRLFLLVLLMAGTAAAQPSPSPRQLRQRALSLLASPVDASVQVAKGTLTTLMFDSQLLPKSVVVQGRDTHFERFVVEERTVTFKPKVDLADDERLLLTVRFADGAAPQEAIFVLVPAGEQVDAAVEVLRRARNAEALQQELTQVQAQLTALQGRCGEGGPSGLILSGMLDSPVGVKWFDSAAPSGNASGLKLETGAVYRTSTWAVVMVRVVNLPGQRPWSPGGVRLFRLNGQPVPVKSVRMEKPQLAPGEAGLVLVETGALSEQPTEDLRLELASPSGDRVLRISGVALPALR
ncbi:DUF2381 family protein [Corallococcus interemptor]|uniref:DUF2381 family protein n=1 Tax=Corallococcus interemptor TaxID=2316720 RepID=A0A3A8R1B6_9BACT|nr:DUF2381 family protein [Corallococcus interemptor]RKH69074.1 DUF2381 family protein [Corallococcus interemptor]